MEGSGGRAIVVGADFRRSRGAGTTEGHADRDHRSQKTAAPMLEQFLQRPLAGRSAATIPATGTARKAAQQAVIDASFGMRLRSLIPLLLYLLGCAPGIARNDPARRALLVRPGERGMEAACSGRVTPPIRDHEGHLRARTASRLGTRSAPIASTTWRDSATTTTHGCTACGPTSRISASTEILRSTRCGPKRNCLTIRRDRQTVAARSRWHFPPVPTHAQRRSTSTRPTTPGVILKHSPC